MMSFFLKDTKSQRGVVKNRASSLAEHDQFTPAVFSRAESSLGTPKSIESIIIQCPHCQTKFALDSGRLEGIENPRFHCSRCDQMFSHNDTSIISTVTSEPQKSPSSFSIPKTIDKGYQPEPPIDSHLTSSNKQIESNPQPLRMTIEKTVTDNSAGLEPSQIEFLFGGDASSRSSSLTQAFVAEPDSTARVFSDPMKELAPERAAVINDIFDEIESSRKQAVSEAQALANRTKLCSIVDLEKPQAAPISQPQAEPKLTTTSLLKEFSLSGKASPIQTSLADAPKRKPPLSAWQSASLLTTALIIFVGFFALLGVCLISSPKFAQAFTGTFAAGAPISPPPGLMISDSTFKQVALDNGEKVSVISGNLVNHSERTIKEVNIDGIAFNNSGGIISSVQGRASSPLSSTRLKSLSLEMIQMLQTKGGTKKFVLKPDATMPFSIVITEPRAENASSFIARIYSVQY